MTVPGSNLLRQALTLIKPQTVRYYADAGRTTSATGRDVTAFAPGVTLTECSVQAVPLTRYEAMGLDFQKYYATLFVQANALGVARDRSGDQFEVDGRRFGIVGETPWFARDGWTALLGIAIGPELFPELFPGYGSPTVALPPEIVPGALGLAFSGASAGSFAMYPANAPIVNGGEYDVTFTLSWLTAGGARVTLYGTNQNAMTQTRTANGTYTERLTIGGSIPVSPTDSIIVQASTDPLNSFLVSNVSVRAAE